MKAAVKKEHDRLAGAILYIQMADCQTMQDRADLASLRSQLRELHNPAQPKTRRYITRLPLRTVGGCLLQLTGSAKGKSSQFASFKEMIATGLNQSKGTTV